MITIFESALLFGVIVPLLYFLGYLFIISRKPINTFRDFFLAGQELREHYLYDTLTVTWLLLGSAILPNLALAMAFGWVNWWVVLTMFGAFYVCGRHAQRIRSFMEQCNAVTLHEFLGSRFQSSFLRKAAAIMTIILSLGIIALELIVGMAILNPLVGNQAFSALAAIGFFMILVIAFYTIRGGLWAIVKTDRVQIFLIILGFISLFLIALRFYLSPGVPAGEIDQGLLAFNWETTVAAGLPFFVGIFFLQMPILLSDFGTWQRIKASSRELGIKVKSALTIAGLLTATLWSVLFIAGIVLTSMGEQILAPLSQVELNAIAGPLLQAIQAGMAPAAFGGTILGAVLIFFLAAGLTAALISSADSYLLVSVQTFVNDILVLNERSEREEKKNVVSLSRRLVLPAALIAFVAALAVIFSGIDPVSYIFIVYGAQTVLAPLAIFALRTDIKPAHYKGLAAGSGIVGFLAAVAFGTWAVFISDSAYFNVNGSYFVPIIATSVPTIVLFTGSWMRDGIREAVHFFTAFIGNYRTPIDRSGMDV